MTLALLSLLFVLQKNPVIVNVIVFCALSVPKGFLNLA